jgi:hypothetical protein
MTISYKFIVGVGLSNCNQEEIITVEELGFNDDEWLRLSSDEQDRELDDFINEWVFEYIDSGWEKVDEE